MDVIIKNETRMIAEGLIRAGMPLHPEYFEKTQLMLKDNLFSLDLAPNHLATY